jgi:hypothetical protein
MRFLTLNIFFIGLSEMLKNTNKIVQNVAFKVCQIEVAAFIRSHRKSRRRLLLGHYECLQHKSQPFRTV